MQIRDGGANYFGPYFDEYQSKSDDLGTVEKLAPPAFQRCHVRGVPVDIRRDTARNRFSAIFVAGWVGKSHPKTIAPLRPVDQRNTISYKFEFVGVNRSLELRAVSTDSGIPAVHRIRS